MNEDSYLFTKEPDIFYYEFFSEGPNGVIRKVVQFQQVSAGKEIYNLGFGDFNIENGKLDDLSISNNHDTRKILTTVARTVIDFMEHHPKAIIMATGSTISRTRLYQINISHFLDEIEGIFEIWGFTGLKWELYKKGNNFESFFIIKK